MDAVPPADLRTKERVIRPPSADDHRFDPSRWWFASSAFPMIAGTLGPVASAFSICALVRPWRQRIAPGTEITDTNFAKDPPWLIAINAVQLVVAIISNVFLLLNMARRVRFSVAQPITIVGWYLSSLCLTALLATAAGPLQLHPASDFIWSQAFWYGLWAAILYFLVATLMSVTVYGALRSHYPLDFQLSPSQRTLMLQTIIFLMYMLIGALVFSTLEGWTYLDSVYWANVTLFTIGFGDLVVISTAGRALIIPYALVGVVSVGLIIGSIRTLVLERARRRVDARMVEKKRRKVVTEMSKQGKDSVLRPIRPSSASPVDGDGTNQILTRQASTLSEFSRRKAEFNLMRLIQHEALVRRRWIATLVSTLPWLVLWLGGSILFVRFEAPYQNWSFFDGVYFTFVSLTTLGFGDVTPVSNGGRSFFVFWALLALPTMTVLISNASDTVVRVIRDAALQLGKITILPGAHGFETDVQYGLHKLSCGLLFRRKFSINNLTSLGESVGEDNDEEEGGEDGSPVPGTQFPNPSSPAEYHYLLITAISTISSEIRDNPDKRYSFHEWAYYLYLLGEDERSPKTHRMARLRRPLHSHSHPYPHTHPHTESQESHPRLSRRETFLEESRKLGMKLRRAPRFEDLEEEAEGEKWSWVGKQSPLMGGRESEWILGRLTARLKGELEGVLKEMD